MLGDIGESLCKIKGLVQRFSQQIVMKKSFLNPGKPWHKIVLSSSKKRRKKTT